VLKLKEQDQEEVEEKFNGQEAMQLCKRTEKMCLHFPVLIAYHRSPATPTAAVWGYLRRTQVASLNNQLYIHIGHNYNLFLCEVLQSNLDLV